MQKPGKVQYIAAAATLLTAFLLLVLLWSVSLGYDREKLAAASIPEEPDEEVYIQPEMLELKPADDAEEEADVAVPSEAEALGLPQKVEQEPPKTQQAVHSDNTTPTQSNQTLVTQHKPSAVQSEPAKPNPKPDQTKLSSQMGAQFNAQNGSTSGRTGAAGSGGTGTSVNSQGIKGRTFKGYVGTVRSKTAFKATVKVRVTVNAAGKVISASLQSAGGAPSDVAQQCLGWAKLCTWSEKAGAADAQGVITYNVVVNP